MAEPMLTYRDGLVVVRAVREAPPGTVWDARSAAWIAPGHRLAELRAWALDHDVRVAAAAPDRAGVALYDPRTPRDYQDEAIARWTAAGSRGTVVLPTGAGKSFIAILAIHRTGAGAVVVAPTRALVAQWFSQLVDAFGAERVGAWYGDEKDVRPITVTTYHSAFALLEREGARYGLLVLDEVHHLADTAAGEAKAWHDALRIAPAPARLGLTATYPDGRDGQLRRDVGAVVYRRTIGEMADAELAGFALERRFVALGAAERERYASLTAVYEAHMTQRGYRERYTDPTAAWKVFMAETRRSPAARRAYRAFLERERLVALPEAKLREALRILGWFPAEQAILFCGSAAAAARLSRRLAIPTVSADTPASERRALLDGMTAGTLRAIASVRVLDEGWDVPTAKLGIVLGDSTRGSPRQHMQRLGRLLRRQGERVASLFEVVVADTHEFYASQKRKAGLGRAAARQLGLGL